MLIVFSIFLESTFSPALDLDFIYGYHLNVSYLSNQITIELIIKLYTWFLVGKRMKNKKSRKQTRTSSFGAPGRESHDSSSFYSSNLYKNLPSEQPVKYFENKIPNQYLNHIFHKSAKTMTVLPDSSVHLAITSPPYNTGKDYDKNFSLNDYLEMLHDVWKEISRVLVPGGRICINIANLGRKPYIPLHAFIINDLINLGFLMRGEIIWDKSASAGSSTAWGSWKSSSNPILRDVHEYILIFSKSHFKREKIEERPSTITRDEFLENTKSVWTFPTVSAKKIGHPAPFPVELPYRLIQLYSYKDEIVLDTFMGSGQTAIAGLKAGRKYIGYEIEKEYVDLANKRIEEYIEEQRKTKLDDFLPPSKNS